MADALSRGDVTASLPQSDDSEKGHTFDAVIATADVAASSRGTFQNRNKTGQSVSVRGGQSVSSPTFDLSMSLLKPLIISSRELSEKVQRDANWADSNQLSATWQGLVLKREFRNSCP